MALTALAAFLLLMAVAGGSAAQPILDVNAVPKLDAAGRAGYVNFLMHAGLADAVVAVSPAVHGSGGSMNLTAQYDDLRQFVDAVPQAGTRLAFAQFKAGPYAGDLSGRRALIERLRPHFSEAQPRRCRPRR